jgi:hypothetical protein
MLNGSEPQDGSIMRLTRLMVSEIVCDRNAAYIWVSIKLLGFHGAYLGEGVQQFLTAYSESERCEVAEEPYERARAKGLAR